MGKFTFNCTIILIYFAQLVPSQTYVKLFSDYLPDAYLKDVDKSEQVEYSLNQFAKTNPDLIYYYLNYLKLISEEKVYNRDSNYYNILQYENFISSNYNNNWVEEEILWAQKLPKAELVLNELESLLEEFNVPESYAAENSVELVVDKNLQKFFSYKCLTSDTITDYNENVDFNNSVIVTIEKMISRIKTEYQIYKSDSNYIPKITMNELLKYHFFSKGFCDSQNGKLDFYLADYLLALIDYPEFMEYSGIIIGLSSEAIRYEFDGVKIKETFLPFQEYSIENTKSELIFYNITAGYNVKLKEYKSVFSHLSLSIGWSFANKKISSATNTMVIDKYFFIWEGEPSNITYLFDGTIDSVSWELNDFYSLTSNIYLPVFYLNQKLYFELGLHYQYLHSEYSISLYRDINDQRAIDTTILGPERETFKQNSEGHLFSGSMIINYSIINPLTLKGVITTLPSIHLGLEYLISL